MMLTDTEKAALVEELAEAIWQADPRRRTGDLWKREHLFIRDRYRIWAEGCLPIIERLLAERDLDALLDSVHPDAEIGQLVQVRGPGVPLGWGCEINIPGRMDKYRAIRPTRIAAVQAAVKAVKEAQ